MHFKLGLISGLIAAAAAHSSETFNGKHLTTKYVQANLQETCFSVRPVFACDNEHVATQISHQKVGFHCMDSDAPATLQTINEVSTGQILEWRGRSQDIQANVEIPIRCERIASDEQVMRKLYENDPEQTVHVIQPNDWNESYCSNLDFYNTKWSEENQINDSSKWSLINNLKNHHVTINDVLKMNHFNFNKFDNMIKYIAHHATETVNENNGETHWKHQINHVLPSFTSRIAKQIFEKIIYDEKYSNTKNEEIYLQYKNLVKRIYSYIVKQVLQTKNLYIHSNEYRKLNTTIRKLWYQVQNSLNKQEVEQVNNLLENFENQRSELDTIFINDIWITSNRKYLNELERQISKILISGLLLAEKQYYKGQDETTGTNYHDFVQHWKVHVLQNRHM